MTIEFCNNSEWIAQLISTEFPECFQNEVTTEYATTAVRFAERAGLTIESARGQRGTCHGWNGAAFASRIGIFGVWGELSNDEQSILESADRIGREAANKLAAGFTLQMATVDD